MCLRYMATVIRLTASPCNKCINSCVMELPNKRCNKTKPTTSNKARADPFLLYPHHPARNVVRKTPPPVASAFVSLTPQRTLNALVCRSRSSWLSLWGSCTRLSLRGCWLLRLPLLPERHLRKGNHCRSRNWDGSCTSNLSRCCGRGQRGGPSCCSVWITSSRSCRCSTSSALHDCLQRNNARVLGTKRTTDVRRTTSVIKGDRTENPNNAYLCSNLHQLSSECLVAIIQVLVFSRQSDNSSLQLLNHGLLPLTRLSSRNTVLFQALTALAVLDLFIVRRFVFFSCSLSCFGFCCHDDVFA